MILPAELPLPGAAISKRQRRLLALFGKLGKADQDSLLAFAEFLQSRVPAADEPSGSVVVPAPKAIARPEEETVIGAIKRLSSTYYMIDKDTLLHESAALLSGHLMQGRPAAEVIDELEQLFEGAYQRLQPQTRDED